MKLSLTLALLLATAISGQANNVLSFGPVTGLNVGGALSFDLALNSTDPVYGYQLDLDYPTFLNFVGVADAGDFITDGTGVFYDSFDDSVGVVTGVVGLLTDPFPGSGDIVNFQFEVVAAGTGSISTANESLFDGDFDTFAVTPPNSMSITTVDAAASTPEPSTAALTILAGACMFWKVLTGRNTIRR